jgi:hypothetical protein
MWRAILIVMSISLIYLLLSGGKSQATPLDPHALCCKPVCGGCFAILKS